MNWYASRGVGRGQGLIIDEDTGRSVAVSYDANDAPLLAEAPALREVCKLFLAGVQAGALKVDVTLERFARDTIEKADCNLLREQSETRGENE